MENKEVLLPPLLRRGETIGIFCPAGAVRGERGQAAMRAGIELIRAQGFLVKAQGAVVSEHAYLADTDAARAENFKALWFDEEVRAILAIRGGYGCLRLLERLDLAEMARRPKLLAGFSDLTVLLNPLAFQAGLLAIHGPVLCSLSRGGEESAASLFSALCGAFPEAIKAQGLEVLRGGCGRGRLAGGNLSCLCHMIGTPWGTSWEGCILLLEDTNEALYRVDRMLTQLKLAGRLDRLAGLILGAFDLGQGDRNADLRLQEAVWERAMELVPGTCPVWAAFPSGHGGRNLALPLGMEATMDSASGRLLLHPGSVRRV